MGVQLAGGNVAIALLANAIATGGALVALIMTFAEVSGAHFNPVVTVTAAATGALRWADVPAYVLAQVVGAFAGVAVAHVMFVQPLFFASTHARAGFAQIFSEAVATFGLLVVIRGSVRHGVPATAVSVAAYITGAYWFTSSTSFANPAVTLARAASDTFAGIRPIDAPLFIVGQIVGAALAGAWFHWLSRDVSPAP